MVIAIYSLVIGKSIHEGGGRLAFYPIPIGAKGANTLKIKGLGSFYGVKNARMGQLIGTY